MRKVCLVAGVVAGAALFCGSVQAAFIPVVNGNFEAGVTNINAGNLGNYNVGDVPGWVLSNPQNSGTFQPGPGAFNLPITDPTKSAYSNGGSLTQVTSENLQANALYVLTVAVGQRLDVGLPTYTLALKSATDQFAFTTIDNPVTPAPGTFQTFKLGFYSSNYASRVGQPLEIYLNSAGAQANFDAVTLEVFTPEPASIGLALTGLVGLLALGRRRMAR